MFTSSKCRGNSGVPCDALGKRNSRNVFNISITKVEALCYGEQFRMYWRISEEEYIPIYSFIGLKAGLNTMYTPRIYVVADESTFRSQFSKSLLIDVLEKYNSVSNPDECAAALDLFLQKLETSSTYAMSDMDVLKCALTRKLPSDDPAVRFDYLLAKTPTMCTNETKNVDRQLKLLMKDVVERDGYRCITKGNKVTSLLEGVTESWDIRRRKDVKGIYGETPNGKSRFDEITNTWRDVKRALSLLCVKKFSGSATMLEAPPGSREDLVEAARTPCTPTDLDTMLYGYTNSIYVLDHTPESLPDMDMLQLFASPAGRALLSSDNRPRGSTSTSSLSRESSSRLKSGRRPSGTGTVSAPTSPPRQRKSSAELYKEAVEILGLTCSLTDSCRCIDCQSNYFDCDDDCGDARTELAAGTPILLDHALSHPLTCSIQ